MINWVISLGLLCAYPLTLHWALLQNSPTLLALAPVLFLLGALWPALITRSGRAWLLLALGLLLLTLVHRLQLTASLLLLPPIIFPALILWVFGRSLIGKREPLITYIGERSRGPLSPAMRHYTRRLTQIWCAVFVCLILQSTALAVWGDSLRWSWWTNVFNYSLVGGLFIGEFWFRKWRFPKHNHPGFFEYLRIIASHPPPSYNRHSSVYSRLP